MKYKTQALQTFKEYVAQYGRPKILRTDNGTEYKNKTFKKFCRSKEIAREFTVPETPEQNCVAERFNRTVVEAARCLLIDSKLPKSYWVRAVDTACYARNLVVKEDESRKNQIWCYLAMTLDASSLMLIRHDCMNRKGLGDGQKAWLLLQQRFRSDETTTVISLMRQLAKLQLREDEAIHQYFIRAQELIMLVRSFLIRCLMQWY